MEGEASSQERTTLSYLQSIERRVISLEDKLEGLQGKHQGLSYRVWLVILVLSATGNEVTKKLFGFLK